MTVPRAITAVRATKVRPDRHVDLPEHVATEEPLQILVAGPGQVPVPVAVSMRTPGHDFELAVGFLISEGLIGRHDISAVGYCTTLTSPNATQLANTSEADARAARFNAVTVHIRRAWDDHAAPRGFVMSASCGVCGKTTIDQIATGCPPVAPAPPVPSDLIPLLPGYLRQAQKTFDRTGGLHAAGLFDPAGHAWCVREDVGRHNAVDKIVGFTSLTGGLPPSQLASLPGWVVMVSGRVSFEIVQKAAQAGIGTIAAVSAPSSLAVSAAERLGVALLAFVRNDTFNIYAHPERIRLP